MSDRKKTVMMITDAQKPPGGGFSHFNELVGIQRQPATSFKCMISFRSASI